MTENTRLRWLFGLQTVFGHHIRFVSFIDYWVIRCLFWLHVFHNVIVDKPFFCFFVPVCVVECTWAWMWNALMLDLFTDHFWFVQIFDAIFSVTAYRNNQFGCEQVDGFFQIFWTNFLQQFLLVRLKWHEKCVKSLEIILIIQSAFVTFSSAGVILRPDVWKNANGHRLWTKQFLKKFSAWSPHIYCIKPQKRWPLCSDLSHSRPVTGRATISPSGFFTEPLNFIQSRTAGMHPNGTCEHNQRRKMEEKKKIKWLIDKKNKFEFDCSMWFKYEYAAHVKC